MKVGDEVIVTYSNGEKFFGTIEGETEKMWLIDFAGEGKKNVKRIRKTMNIILANDESKPGEDKVSSEPSPVTGLASSVEKEALNNEELDGKNESHGFPGFDVEKYAKKQGRWLNWRVGLLVGGALVLAAFAILLALHKIQIGVDGFKFLF